MNVDQLIEIALKEDIGDGDHTSIAIFPPELKGKVKLLSKDTGILAGVLIAEKVYHHVDPSIEVIKIKNDGDHIIPGDILFEARGNVIPLLSAERVVLNFLQRLSGIATETHRIVASLEGLHTKVLDTRKTTPGLRELEKYAVRIGGGFNHRMGLFDMILIKDNHIDFARGISRAIYMAQDYLRRTGKKMKIEVEIRDFTELVDLIQFGHVDRIMLDNFTPDDLSDAVKLIDGRMETEASGGITFENARRYAESGVDYISIGALTHNFRSLDLSMKAIKRSIFDEN